MHRAVRRRVKNVKVEHLRETSEGHARLGGLVTKELEREANPCSDQNLL